MLKANLKFPVSMNPTNPNLTSPILPQKACITSQISA